MYKEDNSGILSLAFISNCFWFRDVKNCYFMSSLNVILFAVRIMMLKSFYTHIHNFFRVFSSRFTLFHSNFDSSTVLKLHYNFTLEIKIVEIKLLWNYTNIWYIYESQPNIETGLFFSTLYSALSTLYMNHTAIYSW